MGGGGEKVTQIKGVLRVRKREIHPYIKEKRGERKKKEKTDDIVTPKEENKVN